MTLKSHEQRRLDREHINAELLRSFTALLNSNIETFDVNYDICRSAIREICIEHGPLSIYWGDLYQSLRSTPRNTGPLRPLQQEIWQVHPDTLPNSLEYMYITGIALQNRYGQQDLGIIDLYRREISGNDTEVAI